MRPRHRSRSPRSFGLLAAAVVRAIVPTRMITSPIASLETRACRLDCVRRTTRSSSTEEPPPTQGEEGNAEQGSMGYWKSQGIRCGNLALLSSEGACGGREWAGAPEDVREWSMGSGEWLLV